MLRFKWHFNSGLCLSRMANLYIDIDRFVELDGVGFEGWICF